MTSAIVSESSGGRQLPTRVSNACDRCRRNKSRCDPFRPCSLCTRANVDCLAGSNDVQSRPAKRKRTRGPSCDESLPPMPQSVEDSYTLPTLVPERDNTSDNRNDATLQSLSEFPRDEGSRRHSVSDGQVDSAMSIAQKVSLSMLGMVQEFRLITEISVRYIAWVVRTPQYFEGPLLQYRVAMSTVSRPQFVSIAPRNGPFRPSLAFHCLRRT
jgi:hypothetical protein